MGLVVQENLDESFRAKPLPQGWLVAVLGIAPLVSTLHTCMAAWGRESLGEGLLCSSFSLLEKPKLQVEWEIPGRSRQRGVSPNSLFGLQYNYF